MWMELGWGIMLLCLTKFQGTIKSFGGVDQNLDSAQGCSERWVLWAQRLCYFRCFLHEGHGEGSQDVSEGWHYGPKERNQLKAQKEGKKNVSWKVLQDVEYFFKRRLLVSSHYCLRIVFMPTDFATWILAVWDEIGQEYLGGQRVWSLPDLPVPSSALDASDTWIAVFP